ncbi:MAG: hypothetical protein ACYSVY_20395 [Planctomycetota bacterium]
MRSRFHGYGSVLRDGIDPEVKFLDGRKCVVSGSTLTVIPEEVYYGEVENRWAIECYLDWRIHGIATPRPRPLPRRRFALVAALQRSMPPLPDVR